MISFIICSITPARYSAVCGNIAALMGDAPHEFVGIHDARSLAEGYNRGIDRAGGDTLVFCHDDIEIMAPDFRERLAGHLERFDLVGVAGSNRFVGPRWVEAGPPHIFGRVGQLLKDGKGYELVTWGAPARCIPGMCLLDGVFLAVRKSLCDDIRFDEECFDGFHLYDLDFSLRASQAGRRLAVCNDFEILHFSRGNWSGDWEKYATMFMVKHGKSARPVPPEDKCLAWSPTRVRVGSKSALRRQFESSCWQE
jgi:glycosyltransferase involved in cell wall biosynthesis